MHTDRMPKTVQRWIDANRDKVADVHVEEDFYGYSDGKGAYSMWIALASGWTPCRLEGVHTVHEATAREALDRLRNLERCDCGECVRLQS